MECRRPWSSGGADHGVAVAAEYECGDILDAHVQFSSNERPEARGVEDAGHADDTLAVEAGLAISGLAMASSGSRR